MRFTDRTLLRLVDADESAAVLTPAVGTALLSAAYSFTDVDVAEVTGVSVRAATLAPVVHPGLTVTATARDLMSPSQWQLAADLPPRAVVTGHAVLEVDVTTRTRGVVSEVVEVQTEDLSVLADLDAVDARVVAADGELPDDADELARRRFEELRDAVAERFTDVPAEAVVETLSRRGLDDLESLMRYLSEPSRVGRLALTVVTDSTTPPSPRTYRMKVLVHVVEALGEELSAALREIALARTAMAAGTDPLPRPSGMTAREAYPALLLFPQGDLDDDDLPTTQPPPSGSAARRAARLTEVTTRLRSAAVVPVPT